MKAETKKKLSRPKPSEDKITKNQKPEDKRSTARETTPAGKGRSE
jgi:hypothetical protein